MKKKVRGISRFSLLFGSVVLFCAFFLHPTSGLSLESQADINTENTVSGGASALASKVAQKVETAWTLSMEKVAWSVVVLLIGWIAITYLAKLLDALAEHWIYFRLMIKRTIPILRVGGWTLLLYMIVADVIAPPIETLVALTASAGIAVGFASQDILKNIFGGVIILFDRPFQIGDKVEVGKYYGEVTHIGLRTVRIVTPDDSLVSIPNSEIVNTSVSNSNAGEKNCQVVAEFYLPPHIDLISAKKIARRAASVSRYVYLNKPISVVLKNEIHEGRSWLKMRLKAYVLDLSYEFAFSTEMTEIVLSEFLKHRLVSAEELFFAREASVVERTS